jgi:hypothetical protein
MKLLVYGVAAALMIMTYGTKPLVVDCLTYLVNMVQLQT